MHKRQETSGNFRFCQVPFFGGFTSYSTLKRGGIKGAGAAHVRDTAKFTPCFFFVFLFFFISTLLVDDASSAVSCWIHGGKTFFSILFMLLRSHRCC